MPLSSTTASPEQSRLGLQAAFSFSGFHFPASDLTHAIASRPTKRAALLSPDAIDAPARSSHRGSRRSGDQRTDEATTSGPQPLELFDSLGSEAAGGGETARPSRRAKSRPAPAPVSAPQQQVAIQVETRVPTAAAPTYVPAPAPQAPARPKRAKSTGPAKLFVLDTNVLLHDPMCLFRFEEHDIFLPMIVLEELDGHKKGTTEVARNGRQTSRTLDALAAPHGADIAKGLKLDTTGHREAGGKLFFQTAPLDYSLPLSLPQGKADNQILGVVQALRDLYAKDQPGHPKQEVVLVSKDINMRVKARALGLAADDYQNDKTLEDGDLLYAGSLALPPDFWTRQSKTVESWQSGSNTFYRVSGPIVPNLYINQFVYFEAPGEPSMYARVTEIRDKTAVLKTLKDYSSGKNAVWGVNTRNREQNFAMNLLMDPDSRLRHADRHGRHRQDADGAGLRPHAGARRPPLHRDHHDPRDGQRG
jgi:PhoH-like ATPase